MAQELLDAEQQRPKETGWQAGLFESDRSHLESRTQASQPLIARCCLIFTLVVLVELREAVITSSFLLLEIHFLLS